MKKLLSIIILGIMSISVLFASGCKSDKKEQKGEGEEQPAKAVVVDVTDYLYGAKGDGVTNDRAAIQLAIDEVSAAGGGQVLFAAGKTFKTGNLLLKSNVELHFGDGAVLLQSDNPNDYVEVRGYDYSHAERYGYKSGFVEKGQPYTPITGVQILPYDNGEIWPEVTGFWREIWYWNYPLVYCDKGTENVKITGNGTIQSMTFNYLDTSDFIYMNMLGFYKTKNVLLSDFRINYEGGHCTNFIMCNSIVISGVDMITPAAVKEDMSTAATICDALKLNNCQDVLVENGTYAGGDDSLLIMCSYDDKRLDRWSSATEVQPTKNIEVSNCVFPSYYKGLGFAALGNACPELDKMEISDVYIHDNKFCSVGMWADHRGWLTNPNLPSYGEYIPIKSIRWVNNDYLYWKGYNHSAESQGVQEGLAQYPISDQICDDPAAGLNSMKRLMNADFEYAKLGYWITLAENGGSITIETEEDNNFAKLSPSLENSAKIYEGVYLRGGKYTLSALVKTEFGAKGVLFAHTADGVVLGESEFENLGEWTRVTLEFTVDGNTLIGTNIRVGLKAVGGAVCCDEFSLVR